MQGWMVAPISFLTSRTFQKHTLESCSIQFGSMNIMIMNKTYTIKNLGGKKNKSCGIKNRI